jgi:hypothetical protein
VSSQSAERLLRPIGAEPLCRRCVVRTYSERCRQAPQHGICAGANTLAVGGATVCPHLSEARRAHLNASHLCSAKQEQGLFDDSAVDFFDVTATIYVIDALFISQQHPASVEDLSVEVDPFSSMRSEVSLLFSLSLQSSGVVFM